MSIEIENPKTKLEKADAAANLIEQMHLAHRMGDEAHFSKAHKEAGSLLADLITELDE